MSNKPLVLACYFDQATVVNLPQTQAKGIRGSVALSHGVGGLQWIAHHDHRFQFGHEILPERQRQAVARIFPAPDIRRTKPLNQKPALHAQGVDTWHVGKFLVSSWRKVPRATECLEQLVIQRDKAQMFPESDRKSVV